MTIIAPIVAQHRRIEALQDFLYSMAMIQGWHDRNEATVHDVNLEISRLDRGGDPDAMPADSLCPTEPELAKIFVHYTDPTEVSQ